MDKRFIGLLFAGAAALSACGGGGSGTTLPGGTGTGGGGGSTPPPSVGKNTIGVALPTGMGTVSTSFGSVGGFTQSVYSQILAFAPGTTITIKNLASNTPHTLNVLGTTGFPSNPTLSTSASGGSSLGSGWTSGTISGGGSVTVTLSNPGTYFIGCAYHYASNAMRDILMVSSSATPGPQATPPASSGGSGGGCTGIYC